MGQRLNFEVCYDGEVIANAYYHWSAYTSSSICILENVINAYMRSTEINPLRIAVEILQSTNAGLNEDEAIRVKKDTSGKFLDIGFHKAINRNEGLLSVTEEGISDTRSWEEGRVSVDIATEEFLFDVLWRETPAEYDECREDGDADNLPTTDFDFDIWHPFSEYNTLNNLIQENPDGLRTGDNIVVCWIE